MKELKSKGSRVRLFMLRVFSHTSVDVLVDILLFTSFVTTFVVLIYLYQCSLSWDAYAMHVLLYELNLTLVAILSFLYLPKVREFFIFTLLVIAA